MLIGRTLSQDGPMSRTRMRAHALATTASLACLLVGTPPAHAQNSFDLSVHASSEVTPDAIGLPVYPGAKLAAKHGDDDAAFDIGFAFGDTRFRLEGISYDSDDSPDRVLEFYRNALARYGDVLECDHGRAVGSLSVTSSGLRCSGNNGAHKVNIDGRLDSSKDHDLRAGSPDEFRIAGIDASYIKSSRFVIMYVKTPKNTGSK
jgi:hypothetical protein